MYRVHCGLGLLNSRAVCKVQSSRTDLLRQLNVLPRCDRNCRPIPQNSSNNTVDRTLSAPKPYRHTDRNYNRLSSQVKIGNNREVSDLVYTANLLSAMIARLCSCGLKSSCHASCRVATRVPLITSASYRVAP